MLNILNDPAMGRRLQLTLYVCGALAGLVMGIVGSSEARLPWFIVALFSAGSFVDLLRDKTANH